MRNVIGGLLRWKSDPLDNCTPRVQRVCVLAREEADRFRHDCIEAGHFLLGILALGEGVGCCALRRRNVNLIAFAREVRQQLPPANRDWPGGERPASLPISGTVEHAFHLGAEEARRLGHAYLGTEHLLLGIVRLKQRGLVPLMLEHGIALGQLRSEIRDITAPDAEQTDKTPTDPSQKTNG